MTYKQIKKIRLKLKMTQKEFSAILGFSKNHFQKLETGRAKITKSFILHMQIIKKHGIKVLMLAFFALGLFGCGVYEAQPPGVYGVPESRNEFLKYDLEAIFLETKECTGLQYGAFSDISFTVVEGSFICDAGNLRAGCFIVPNIITIVVGMDYYVPYILRHEIIHYLLYLDDGNLDAQHVNDLFYLCE